MEELGPGLYETLITEGLTAQLDALSDRLQSRVRGLRAAETPDRIAWHLSKQIESALADVGDTERVEVGLSVARALRRARRANSRSYEAGTTQPGWSKPRRPSCCP